MCKKSFISRAVETDRNTSASADRNLSGQTSTNDNNNNINARGEIFNAGADQTDDKSTEIDRKIE